jgi:Flp pilus assembly protein CpaB
MAQRAASSAQGRLNRRFLLVAILLAGLSAALVYARIAATDDGSSGGGSTAAGDQRVVVARIAIQERTTITSDMLELKSISANSVTTGALTTIEDAVGKVTKFPIEVNQQVLTTAIVDTARPVSDAQLALVVPTDKRAFSISASQVLTAGGLLLPGDYVDVVWMCCENGIEWQGNAGKTISTSAVIFSRPVLQNVQVLAVAQQIVPSGPVATGDDQASAGGGAASENPVAADTPNQIPDAATITLLVSPDQAGVLLMAEATGILRVALRNPGDTNTIAAASETQFITPNLIPEEIMRQIQNIFTTTQ